MAPGKSGVPGVTGTRCLGDNLSDLKAQVAANAKGIALVQSLIAESSLGNVQRYMGHIQDNAEAAVRQMLCDFSRQQVRQCLVLNVTYSCIALTRPSRVRWARWFLEQGCAA